MTHSDAHDTGRPADGRGERPADGAPRPDPQLPPPERAVTPVPAVDPGDEGGRQTAATVQSVRRVEEAN